MIIVYRSSMFAHLTGNEWVETLRTRDWAEAEAEVSALHDRGFRAAVADASAACLVERRSARKLEG